ncbi:MAG: c-type cytochrome, partial [Nitrospiria bacterium]
ELWSLVAYVRTLHPNEENEIVFTKPGTEEPVFEKKRVRYPKVREKKFYDLLETLAPDEEAYQEQVVLGEEIFSEVGCNACHKVNGEGGELGPDLSRAGFMLQTQFIFRWILNPQSFKPKTRMANLDLNEEDAFAISLYLSTLKADSPGSEFPGNEGSDAEDEGV